jgi:pimeloyl-ACP methyl ester carboxylesterase
VAIGFPLVLFLMQDRLIFSPQPLAEEARAAIVKRFTSIEDLFLNAADGTRLHAWHVKAPGKAPLILYFGGNAEEVSWMVNEALERTPGVSWLLVDYRGYGASEGAPSELALTSDALLWYDRLAPQSGRVFVFGRSLGSGVAVRLAAERPVAGVVLVAPYDSLVEVAKRYYPYLPVSWMLRHRFDSASLAPRIGAPLLCLVATRDEVIPPEHAKRLFDAWAGPKRWVALQGASHNDTDTQQAYWESIKAFLDSHGH